MDRLSLVLTLMTGSVLAGGLTILVLGLGYYSWPAIGIAAGLGFILSWPAAYVVSRRIKRRDPEWDETAVKDAGVIPRPGAPEV